MVVWSAGFVGPHSERCGLLGDLVFAQDCSREGARGSLFFLSGGDC